MKKDGDGTPARGSAPGRHGKRRGGEARRAGEAGGGAERHAARSGTVRTTNQDPSFAPRGRRTANSPTEVEELGGADLPAPVGCGLRVGGGRRLPVAELGFKLRGGSFSFLLPPSFLFLLLPPPFFFLFFTHA